MKVRPMGTRASMGVCVASRLLDISPNYLRLVRALFIAHMSVAQRLIHSKDGGCGNGAARDRSATRTSNGLIAFSHRLPFLKVAAAIARVRIEWHFRAPFDSATAREAQTAS
jgi:hypothetical protein